ncbi:hypothetical protein EST38_g9163 [Candolleomyces aberdarensis]|uniref:Uncharacterized protein n=1 Tax=Candolleomyces aberdarensis TaxID=2316362 RepID=A0A4Q2DCU1_9AGAR|nr:hypothetical protein EST38_g9163 [Candolleomyces aberdarensis]
MFEHLVIDRPWQLEVLLHTLPRLPAGRIDPDDSRTLGWFVKRLDLLIPNLEWLRVKRENSEVYSLSPTLCTFLPNLLSLNVSGAPLSYFPPGTDVISPSLKQLCWTDDATSPTLQDLKDLTLFMDNHPNITVVCLPPTDIGQWPPESNSSLGDWERVCWPELEELIFTTSVRVRVFYNAFRAGSFPGLKRLAFPYSSSETLGVVLGFCGANLERLHLSHYGSSSRVFWPLDTTLAMIQAIQRWCTNLREFRWSIRGRQLPDGEWVDTLDEVRIPGVTVFGAHWISPIEGGYGYARFCKHILCWVRIFPDLKVVRLFGEANVQALLEEGKAKIFNDFLEECRQKEVRVEDIFGGRIVPQGLLV